MTINTRIEPLLPRFASVEKVIERLKPTEPVYVLHPARFAEAAKRFLDQFPGDTMYAVKANPAPLVLDQVWAAGIRHYDTASLPEIELVRGKFPDAICHFMAPVAPRWAARRPRSRGSASPTMSSIASSSLKSFCRRSSSRKRSASLCASPRPWAAR
ncbi:MAG: hypothetical protein WDM89_20510 [Rhizomicrobium sp.]